MFLQPILNNVRDNIFPLFLLDNNNKSTMSVRERIVIKMFKNNCSNIISLLENKLWIENINIKVLREQCLFDTNSSLTITTRICHTP